MTQTLDPTLVPWRLFRTALARRRQLSPTFVRLTLAGDELVDFADNGYDQRIKLVLPAPVSAFDCLVGAQDWYAAVRAQPDHDRNAVRTYTVRSVRSSVGEIDIDVALHGPVGPASRWAAGAAVGDEAMVLGPNASYAGQHGGVEWNPPPDVERVLLVGDETAVPAVAGILERLPADTRGDVLLEVPFAEDFLPLSAPAGVLVSWFARGSRSHGAVLDPAVRAVARSSLTEAGVDEGAPLHDDEEILWDVPEAVRAADGVYAWLAGEAGMITGLRRYLVRDLGVDRRAVAFMGYWRLGRSES